MYRKQMNHIVTAAALMAVVFLAACGAATIAAGSAPISAQVDEARQRDLQDVQAAPAASDLSAASAPAATQVTDTMADQGYSTVLSEETLTQLYDRINPGVVNIVTNAGEGSGFVYDGEGHIVTNNHVVTGASRIVVRFADGTEADAAIVGSDTDSDLAVLSVEVPAAQLTVVPIGTSNGLHVGQFVVAIGNPYGLQGSMTTGIISGLGRLLDEGQGYSISDVIQTDAAINPGNSGGPLLNLRGELIGVNTAIESPVRANSGIGYAVPADIVARIVPQLIENGEASYPWLGLSGGTLPPAISTEMGLDSSVRGVLVGQVIAGGPAAQAGVRGSTRQATIDGVTVSVGGDVIVAIDQLPVVDFDDLLTYLVQETEPGQTVVLTVLRGGNSLEIPVVLGERARQ